MTDAESFDVVCPHCMTTFSAQLTALAALPYMDSKCPLCWPLVPAERTDAEEPAST